MIRLSSYGFVPAYNPTAHYDKEINASPIIGPHLIYTCQGANR